jgi:hypothetical protein
MNSISTKNSLLISHYYIATGGNGSGTTFLIGGSDLRYSHM